MNLEEIINAAVEKRLHEIVNTNTTLRSATRRFYGEDELHDDPSTIDEMVNGMIMKIAKEKLEAFRPQIEAAIVRAFSEAPQNIRMDVSTQLRIPAEKK